MLLVRLAVAAAVTAANTRRRVRALKELFTASTPA
jgi:hypothetical protein